MNKFLTSLGLGGVLLWTVFALSAIPAYITALVTGVNHINEGLTAIAWTLVCAIIPVFGVVHGWYIWIAGGPWF